MNKGYVIQNILLGRWKRWDDLDEETKDKAFYRWQQTAEPYIEPYDEFRYFADEWEKEGYDIVLNDFDYSVSGGQGDYAVFKAYVNAVTWIDFHKDKVEKNYPDFCKLIELANGYIDVNVFIGKMSRSMYVSGEEVIYDDETIGFDQDRANELLSDIAADILQDAENKAADLRRSLLADYEYQSSREYFDENIADMYYDDSYYFDESGDYYCVQ